MRIVGSIADWFERRGWEVLLTIELIIFLIFMFGGTAALICYGIFASIRLGSFGVFLLYLLGATLNFFVSAFFCGVTKGIISLITNLKRNSSQALNKVKKIEEQIK